MRRRVKKKAANLASMEQAAKSFMRSCVGKYTDERLKKVLSVNINVQHGHRRNGSASHLL